MVAREAVARELSTLSAECRDFQPNTSNNKAFPCGAFSDHSAMTELVTDQDKQSSSAQ
jgi:hypothetical protein